MKKRVILSIIVIYIVCLTGFTIPALAQGNESNKGADTFSYKIIQPENQRESAGYFDLVMKPSQKQTVQIELFNPSPDKTVSISVLLNSTKTNSNGVLEYGAAAIENDASLKYDFTKIVKAPKTVDIPPKETVMLDLEIAMPDQSYDGVIAGGIQLQAVPTKEEEAANKKAQGVINKYAYIIAMLLSETETKVEPEIQFNKISAGLSNYRNAIYLNFSNIQSTFLAGMSVDMQVMKKGSKEVLYDTKQTELKMAPNSMINFPLMMNGDNMEAGDYTGHVLVTIGDKKWEWTQDFKITKEEAEKYNAQDVSLTQERGIDWKLIVLIVAGVLVVLILIFVLVRIVNKKKKKKNRRKKKGSKKQ